MKKIKFYGVAMLLLSAFIAWDMADGELEDYTILFPLVILIFGLLFDRERRKLTNEDGGV